MEPMPMSDIGFPSLLSSYLELGIQTILLFEQKNVLPWVVDLGNVGRWMAENVVVSSYRDFFKNWNTKFFENITFYA